MIQTPISRAVNVKIDIGRDTAVHVTSCKEGTRLVLDTPHGAATVILRDTHSAVLRSALLQADDAPGT